MRTALGFAASQIEPVIKPVAWLVISGGKRLNSVFRVNQGWYIGRNYPAIRPAITETGVRAVITDSPRSVDCGSTGETRWGRYFGEIVVPKHAWTATETRLAPLARHSRPRQSAVRLGVGDPAPALGVRQINGRSRIVAPSVSSQPASIAPAIRGTESRSPAQSQPRERTQGQISKWYLKR